MAIHAAISAGFAEIARRSERALAAYPWRNEDYLRYLLPSLFEREGEEWTMITGPSEAREDLLHQRFEAAFPGVRAYQGGMSLGTIDDLLIVLDYLEQAYGKEALPGVLLLGITPRFVANISSIAVSPVATSIDRYSPYFSVERTPEGPQLREKNGLASLASRLRFVPKQPSRYQAALCGAAGRQLERLSLVGRSPWLGNPDQAAQRIRAPLTLVRLCGSPYKYHHARPLTTAMIEGWLSDSTSFWWKTHNWQPLRDSLLITSRLTRLVDFARANDIALYVVNLPEHPLNRRGYHEGRYEEYLRLMLAAIGDTPFLDLRNMLQADEFYDAGHARLGGAIVVTDSTIQFMRRERALGARGSGSRVTGAGQ